MRGSRLIINGLSRQTTKIDVSQNPPTEKFR